MKFKKLKIKNLLFVGLSLLPWLFSSCIYDEFDLNSCLQEDEKPVAYMTVKINHSDGMSTKDGMTETENKALGDVFSSGLASDYAIAPGKHHYMLLYRNNNVADEEGNSLEPYMPLIISLNQLKESSINDPNYSPLLLATLFDTNIRDSVDISNLLKRFTDCFVILNTDLKESDLNVKKKDLLEKKIAENISIEVTDEKGNTSKYLTMSNAVYCTDNSEIKYSYKINPKNIFRNNEEAINSALLGNAAIEVAVERLASKFELVNCEKDKIYEVDKSIFLFEGLDENNTPIYKNDYDYKVKITGWGMNARQKKSFLLKNLGNIPPGGYFKDWCSESLGRTYWSVDPDYIGKTNYPLQFRKAKDNIGQLKYYERDITNEKDNNILQNFSYDDIISQDNFGKIIYTHENTYDLWSKELIDNHDGRRDLLVGTHLLITAELLTKFKGDEYKAIDLYRDNYNNFYLNQRDCLTALVSKLDKKLNDLEHMVYYSYNWKDDNKYTEEIKEVNTHGKWQLYYKGVPLINLLKDDPNGMLPEDMTIPAFIERGDGKRMIWDDNLSIRYYYDNGEFKDLFDNNSDELKSFLFQYLGAIDHFNQGKMYYAVPVELSKQDDQGNEIYGVVRNLSYSFSVIGVNGIGVSVDKTEDEIVPNINPDARYIGIKLDVFPWKKNDVNIDW